MKSLLMVLTMQAILTSAAYAAGPKLSDYTLVTGGWGIDGATETSMPKEDPIKEANEIFAAMKGKPNEKGEKFAGFTFKSDRMGLVCRKGIGCDLSVVLATRTDKAEIGLDETVEFRGKAAKKIYEALPEDSSKKVGASTREAGNVSCKQITYKGFPVICTVRNTSAVRVSLEEAVEISEGKLTRKDAVRLIKASKLD